MIPLRDNAPCQREPVVTYTIMALCLLVFLGQWIYPGGFEASLQDWGEIPTRILAGGTIPGTSLPAWLTMFSSFFMHGGVAHIIGNLWALWLFGDNVEWLMGRFRFSIFYLACGILSSSFTVFFGHDGTLPGIGASGAIAGVMAAYLLFFPRARITSVGWISPFSLGHYATGDYGFVMRNISALWFIGSWVLFQLVLAFILGGSGLHENLGIYAHAAGAVAGAALAFLLVIPERRPGADHPISSDEITAPLFGDSGSGGGGEIDENPLGAEIMRLREAKPGPLYPPASDARVDELRQRGELPAAIAHCRDMLAIAAEQQNPRLVSGYRQLLGQVEAELAARGYVSARSPQRPF